MLINKEAPQFKTESLFDEKTGLQRGQRKSTMENYSSDRERGVQIPKPDNMARNVPSLG